MSLETPRIRTSQRPGFGTPEPSSQTPRRGRFEAGGCVPPSPAEPKTSFPPPPKRGDLNGPQKKDGARPSPASPVRIGGAPRPPAALPCWSKIARRVRRQSRWARRGSPVLLQVEAATVSARGENRSPAGERAPSPFLRDEGGFGGWAREGNTAPLPRGGKGLSSG
ncbi:hypothetical protein AGDE_15249 [Angomonas deanei]|uniref:Uncharacterized protein n=1 Tax=Angomonas deanei TaxID=59799 RepID=A0A7G2CD10_9TRYP|nr:hypothetical protein AGDE_15249 [Angomonas deanei]CAD2217325.1 hypothetical protein, conserved [Angomonas deanei]|eukprot:EPY19419.1 hypothetical protein AGDE_15249 [Angomonas deanei]